jgi:AAA15 family ATPase/GTPase
LLLLRAVFEALDKGSVLFIDELDASLHTQVGNAVLALFSDKALNAKGAQLLATTHDTNLMTLRTLRRDQIWFTEKDSFGATHLFPLSDIRTRNTDNIEKGYLQGRYGAIPFGGNVDELLSQD